MVERVLIAGWNERLILAVLSCVGEAGLRPFVLAPGRVSAARLSRYCGGYDVLTAPLGDLAAFTVRVEEVCRRRRIAIVMPAGDESTRFLSSWCPPEGVRRFPTPSLAQVQTCADKWRFAEACRELGVAHPRTERADSPAELRSVASRGPCFIKPVVGAGGQGTAHVTSPADLDAWLDRESWRPMLVQEFVPGDDLDVSVLCDTGRVVAWTSQRTPPDVLSRHVGLDLDAFQACRGLLEELRWHGVAHLDLRRDGRDGRIKVLELNPRFWASLNYSTWAGVNFAMLGLALAHGEPVTAPTVREGTYRRLPLSAAGLLRSVFARQRGVHQLIWPTLSDPLPQVWLGARARALI